METKKTEEFLELYKRLEALIRDVYDLDRSVGAVAWLKRNDNSYRHLSTKLQYIIDVRNLLQHNGKLGDEYPVIPSNAMLNTMRQVIRSVEAVPKARNLGVKGEDIFSASMGDPILPVMQTMARESYTHVPILENGVVVGVFSESTLLSYLMDHDVVRFEEGDRFDLLSDYLPLDKHRAETFRFVSIDASAPKIAGLFQEALRNSERLGIVFVTAHGRPDERLWGMLTSWDMAAFF